MKSMIHTVREFHERSHGQHLRYRINNEPGRGFVSESYLKVSGGVRYLVQRWGSAPTAEQLIEEALHVGRFSARPYTLAQSGDPSVRICVQALFFDFCRGVQLSPIVLLKEAFPDEEHPYEGLDAPAQALIRAHAEWEGTCFPKVWDTDLTWGLFESLHSIELKPLAEVIAYRYLAYAFSRWMQIKAFGN